MLQCKSSMLKAASKIFKKTLSVPLESCNYLTYMLGVYLPNSRISFKYQGVIIEVMAMPVALFINKNSEI